MSIIRGRPMAVLVALGARRATRVVQEGGQPIARRRCSSKDGALSSAIANASGSATPDPCTLLSANEAEVYVGVLAHLRIGLRTMACRILAVSRACTAGPTDDR